MARGVSLSSGSSGLGPLPSLVASRYNGGVTHEYDTRIAYAVRNTYVVRPPRQMLATFGTTTIRYYLVTEPVYAELDPRKDRDEAVVREGTVMAERPQVVTPYYLSRAEGFTDNAGRYLERLVQEYGPHAPGLLYAYKNQDMQMSIVSGAAVEVASRLRQRLDREDRRLEAVIRGVDELWDVSLMKFIYELTSASVRSNVSDLHRQGLFEMEGDVPREARQRIERLLEEARRGHADPSEVKRELDRWGLFEEYQDVFLSLFKRR